jgi:hypothetical protein
LAEIYNISNKNYLHRLEVNHGGIKFIAFFEVDDSKMKERLFHVKWSSYDMTIQPQRTLHHYTNWIEPIVDEKGPHKNEFVQAFGKAIEERCNEIGIELYTQG